MAKIPDNVINISDGRPHRKLAEEQAEGLGGLLLQAVADAHINLAVHMKNTAPLEAGDVSIEQLLLNDFREPEVLAQTWATTLLRLEQRRTEGEDI